MTLTDQQQQPMNTKQKMKKQQYFDLIKKSLHQILNDIGHYNGHKLKHARHECGRNTS